MKNLSTIINHDQPTSIPEEWSKKNTDQILTEIEEICRICDKQRAKEEEGFNLRRINIENYCITSPLCI